MALVDDLDALGIIGVQPDGPIILVVDFHWLQGLLDPGFYSYLMVFFSGEF
jgi:hypothetical protein